MKIAEALKVRKKGQYLKSESVGMYMQRPKSLLFWLLKSDSSDEYRLGQYKRIIEATDWEIET